MLSLKSFDFNVTAFDKIFFNFSSDGFRTGSPELWPADKDVQTKIVTHFCKMLTSSEGCVVSNSELLRYMKTVKC